MLLIFSSQFPNPLSHKETQISETGADTVEEDHFWREWMKTVSTGKQGFNFLHWHSFFAFILRGFTVPPSPTYD